MVFVAGVLVFNSIGLLVFFRHFQLKIFKIKKDHIESLRFLAEKERLRLKNFEKDQAKLNFKLTRLNDILDKKEKTLKHKQKQVTSLSAKNKNQRDLIKELTKEVEK